MQIKSLLLIAGLLFLNTYGQDINSIMSDVEKSLNNENIDIQKKWAPATNVFVPDITVDAKAREHLDTYEKKYTEKREGCKECTIGVGFSGGSVRAMICSLAFLDGLVSTPITAEKSLLDYARYQASISGGAWGMGFELMRDTTPEKCKESLKKRIVSDNGESKKTLAKMLGNCIKAQEKEILYALYKTYKETGTITPVDLWGTFLVAYFFGDIPDAHLVTMQTMCKQVLNDPAKYPFPIISTVLTKTPALDLVEIGPFATYSPVLGAAIPTQVLGSFFEAGKLKNLYLQKTIGYLLATASNIWNVGPADILEQLAYYCESETVKKMLAWIVETYQLSKIQFFGSPIPNFVYGMDNMPFAKEKNILLKDAGFRSNLPLEVLLDPRRKVDIILMCDASEDASLSYNEIKNAALTAKEKKLKFPPIEYPIKVGDYLLIFRNDFDLSVPTIFYFINTKYHKSTQFLWSEKQFDDMYNAMKKQVQDSVIYIKKEIERRSPSNNLITIWPEDLKKVSDGNGSYCY